SQRVAQYDVWFDLPDNCAQSFSRQLCVELGRGITVARQINVVNIESAVGQRGRNKLHRVLARVETMNHKHAPTRTVGCVSMNVGRRRVGLDAAPGAQGLQARECGES